MSPLKAVALTLGLLPALAGCAVVQRPNTDQPNLGLTLPPGFTIKPYAQGFDKPRLMALAPGGDVFLTDTKTGQVWALQDRNGDGVLDDKTVFAAGLKQPHGLAFHGGFLYVANTDAVVRLPYKAGDLKATGPAEKVVDLPDGGLHYTRTVVFGPDDRMYVASGSSCNVCEEGDPRRAAVWVYDADGKNGKPYATGLRNAVGLLWAENTFYATVNGRDLAGNDIPPESFYTLKEGQNYGWPYCYPLAAGQPQTWDKDFGKKDPGVCAAAQPSFATTTAHAAPLGLTMYAGKAFPAPYQNKLFVALHGSWNRAEKSGYKVVTVDPQSGAVQDFVGGFQSGLTTTGRPVDLLGTPDGALLLTDDGNGIVYRISYQP